jgi:hypothetical protein
MQVDPELALEFFENVLSGLSVEHDTNKKVNTAVLQWEREGEERGRERRGGRRNGMWDSKNKEGLECEIKRMERKLAEVGGNDNYGCIYTDIYIHIFRERKGKEMGGKGSYPREERTRNNTSDRRTDRHWSRRNRSTDALGMFYIPTPQ